MATTDPIAPWDATVQGVMDLLPAATFPVTLEAGKKGITQAMIASYIGEVSGRVSARLVGWEALSGTTAAAITTAARDLTEQGAASYAQAARFPEQSSPRNTDGYAAVLWARFTTGLDLLAARVAEELTDPTLDAGGGASGADYYFPAPTFAEGFEF